jgi:hypothetical protein
MKIQIFWNVESEIALKNIFQSDFEFFFRNPVICDPNRKFDVLT